MLSKFLHGRKIFERNHKLLFFGTGHTRKFRFIPVKVRQGRNVLYYWLDLVVVSCEKKPRARLGIYTTGTAGLPFVVGVTYTLDLLSLLAVRGDDRVYRPIRKRSRMFFWH